MDKCGMIYLLKTVDGRQTDYLNLEHFETQIREEYDEMLLKLRKVRLRDLRIPPYSRFRNYINSVIVAYILTLHPHNVWDRKLLNRLSYYSELSLPPKVVELMSTIVDPEVDYSIEPQSDGWPIGLPQSTSRNLLVSLVRPFIEECAINHLIQLVWTS